MIKALELGACTMLTLFGCVAVAVSYSYGLGSVLQPGAGLAPFVASSVLVGFLLLDFFDRLISDKQTVGKRDQIIERPQQFAIYAVVLVLWPVCLSFIGYPIATSTAVAVLVFASGGGAVGALTTSALSTAASVYLFRVLLEVPLPLGLW